MRILYFGPDSFSLQPDNQHAKHSTADCSDLAKKREVVKCELAYCQFDFLNYVYEEHYSKTSHIIACSAGWHPAFE